MERMRAIERIPTGIPGLDEMINGGLPFPSLTLVAGDIGSGKATFSMQFLCKGAELKEPGLYFVTFGGPPEGIFKFISTYEFGEQKYLGNEIKYIDLGECIEATKQIDDVLETIRSSILKFRPKRIAMDSLSSIKDIMGDDYKRLLPKLCKMIRDLKIAILVTGESMPGSPYPVDIAHLADGVILLHNTEVNLARRRSIEILKMRGTSHPCGKFAVDISTKGLTVYPGLQL
jgi:KaiC/GvpD/RAD55 family RecA-like ATPase